MAPITTTLLFASVDLTSSAVVRVAAMPSSTSSIYVHSPTTSPKQFIPVGVLTMFLILLFFSHLMRYPRFLYVSHELPDSHSRSTQDNYNPDQPGHRNSLEKEVGAGFFRRPSFSGPKRLSSFQPHTEAIYSEPTVRLVRGYHNLSPEPRVYLPEEITVPSPSRTLVDSPCTNSSILDHQSVLPRVYLPPVSPEKFELDLSHQRAEMFCNNHDSFLSSDLQWMPSSSHWPPGLSTLPLAHSSTGCYARITASSDMLALPFVQDQLQGSAKSISSAVEDLELGLSHVNLSPEPSPPPLAHAHPILVKRALSPWRRRSCPIESYDSFLQMDMDITGASSHRHRPSVPSRLRYFITRSVATSLSGSLKHSTPVSSSARKCSESSQPKSRPNSHPEALVLKSCRAERSSRFSDDLLNASAKMSALATTSNMQLQSSTLDQSPTPGSQFQQGTSTLNTCRQPPSTEDAWRHSYAPSSNISEDMAEAKCYYQKEASSLLSANMHRPVFDNGSSVGLGLDLDAERRSSECQTHHRPTPSSSSQTSADTCTLGAAASYTHGKKCDEFGRVAPYFQAFGNSLRTVRARWMMSSSPVFDDGVRTLAEEMGPGVPINGIPDDVVIADVSGSGSESVEIMVMRRSEGLDGI